MYGQLQADDSFSIEADQQSITLSTNQYNKMPTSIYDNYKMQNLSQPQQQLEDGLVRYLVNGDVSGLYFLSQNVVQALIQQKRLVGQVQYDLQSSNGSLSKSFQQLQEMQQIVTRQITEAQHKISFLSAKVNKSVLALQQKLETVNEQITHNKNIQKNIQANIKLLAYAAGVGIDQQKSDISNEQFYTIIDIISTKLKRNSQNQIDVDSFLSENRVSSFLATDDEYQHLQKKISLLTKQLNEVKLENAQLIQKNKKIMEKNKEIVNENIFYRTHIDQLQKKTYEIELPQQFTYHKFVMSNEQELFLKNRPDFGNIVKDISQLNQQLNSILNVKIRKAKSLQNSKTEIPEPLIGIYQYFYNLIREIEELNKTTELIKTKQFLHQLIGLE